MDLDKEVFTTFETADICNANITSIKNWIDRGELDAFQTPGGHYRIERETLENFLDRHGMPNPFAEHRQKRILMVDPTDELVDEIEKRWGGEYDCDITRDPVDALLRIGQWKPDVAVVDCRIEELDIGDLCRRVGEHSELQLVDLVVVVDGDDAEASNLRDAGADYVVERDESARIVENVAQALE